MGNETSKSLTRRLRDPVYATHYFVGDGIDIGAGGDGLEHHAHHFPRMASCRSWDVADGDAQYMASIPDNTFDFVHSSHCLEHVHDAHAALKNWFRILKPGGHLIVIVPDEDMYEQGHWPSRFNSDHKHTFTPYKRESWSPASINVTDLVRIPGADLIKIEWLHHSYSWSLPSGIDQTAGPAEAAIEFVLSKRAGELEGS